MAWSSRVTTLTQSKIIPKVVDSILLSNVFTTRMLMKAKNWNGETMKFPVKVSTNTTGQSWSGFDTFATSPTNNRVLLQFTPKFYQITCALPLDEVSVNNTEEKVLDLIAVEMTTTAQDAADGVGTLMFGDGTSNSNKAFTGLAAAVDDGTTASTYGGLSRSTYSTLCSTRTASSGTLSLAKMSTLYNAITSGSQKPSVGITTPTVFSLYEQLLQPQERIAKDVPMMKSGGRMDKAGTGFVGGTGFTGLFFKGFPILADEKCTSGYLYFLNEDFMDFYALPVAMTEPVKYRPDDVEGNDYSDVPGLGFSSSGWIKSINQAAIVNHIFLGGDLITQNPRRHGVLTGVTSV
jgi:hypothetical protein